MSIGIVMSMLLSGACVVLLLIISSLRKDLKKAWSDLDDAKAEIISRKNEMEVIRNVEKELKESKGKKAPESVATAPTGDSASRLSRLNGVSDNKV